MFNTNLFLPRTCRRFLRTRIRPPTRPLRDFPIEQNHNERSTPISSSEISAHNIKAPIEESPPGLTKYAYRWDTTQPTGEQLGRADFFFTKYPAKHLWSEAKFKKIDYGSAPEVAFLGRSNVGKSTLLNALLNHKGMAYTSNKPGRTRLLNAFAINQGKLVLLDMPGYGHASREDWGTQVMKYLTSRKQFRRAFVLINAHHGPKASDLMLLEQLGAEGISYQVLLSKVDQLSVKGGSLQRAFEDTKFLIDSGIAGVSGLGEVLGVAGDPSKKGPKIGISDLRWSVMVACGLDSWKK